MTFGRQNNLVRRPVRPDGRINRDLRRKKASKASLLDLPTGNRSLLSRVAHAVANLFGKR